MTASPPWKTVWVTGASTGIGREIALQLAAAGVKVAASARSAEKLTALGSSVLAVPLDVTDAQACRVAVQEIEAKLGPVSELAKGHDAAAAGAARRERRRGH